MADVVIHPVVELKVGKYKGNETAHRNCEMHQDVYIYHKVTGYGEISDTEHLSSFAKECSDNGDTKKLNKTISSIWGKMLEVLSSEEYSTNKPEFDTWHSRFHKIVSLVEETQRLPSISRHVIGLDSGAIYPLSDDVDRKNYIENLDVPGNNKMHYDDIFAKAVEQVQQTWKVLDDAVYSNKTTYSEYFADWNLDNGRTSSGSLVYWTQEKIK